MPHFFINTSDIINDKVIIKDKDNYVHIAKSLRTRIGEPLLLIDENKIQYEAVVVEISKTEVITEIKKRYESKRILPFNIYLAQSPLHSDAQNYIIEKSTELGVKGVYPILTDNCTVKKDTIEKKIDKWQRIMCEASKQCERATIPRCLDLTTIENLLNMGNFDKIIAFCERIADKTIKDTLPIKTGENILVIIGPEGGFSKREFEIFSKNPKVKMLTLGDMILKADTAVVVALGNLIYEFTNTLKN